LILSMMFSLVLGFTAPTAGDKDIDQLVTPIMRILQPSVARAGDVVLVTGENLGKPYVAAVYVSDGIRDRKVEITEQTEISLKFAVPASCKPGKYKIVVLLNRLEAILIEEPVKLVVIE